MKESILSKITASVSVAKGMAQRVLTEPRRCLPQPPPRDVTLLANNAGFAAFQGAIRDRRCGWHSPAETVAAAVQSIRHQIVVVTQGVLDVEGRAGRCIRISSARGKYTQGPIILSALIRNVIIAMLRTLEQPGRLRISANARASKSCIESRVLAIFRSVNLPQSPHPASAR
jgi:hypothetical protein